MKGRLKRSMINGAALLVIVVIALMAVGSYTSDEDKAVAAMRSLSGLPPLKELTLIPQGVDVDVQNQYIQVALEIKPGFDESNLVEDVLTLYRWGSRQLKPGGGMAITMVVQRDDIPSWDDPLSGVQVFYVVLIFGLEKTQIDRMLWSPPVDLDGLAGFHQSVMTTSDSGAGFVNSPEPAYAFPGFQNGED